MTQHIHKTASQATIKIDLPDSSSFENFIEDSNAQVVRRLKDFVTSRSDRHLCYLWGVFGVGKTHLLYAACHCIQRSIYVSLKDLDLYPEVLSQMQLYDLVCVDDVHSIAGQPHWERHLMALFEKVVENGKQMIVSASVPPQELKFMLPDLMNRFCGEQMVKLAKPSEPSIARIFADKAARRGLIIEDSVVKYVMKRYSHDLHSLIRLLDRISQLSLAEKRNVTIPFLKNLKICDH